jgi:hypothetical protein
VPVPTPFFVQEFLLGNFNDPDRRNRLIPSLVKLFLTLEVTEMDRRFHDDIMGDKGKWWLHPNERPLSFMVLWRMLEKRTKDVSNMKYIHWGNYLDQAACRSRNTFREAMAGISTR